MPFTLSPYAFLTLAGLIVAIFGIRAVNELGRSLAGLGPARRIKVRKAFEKSVSKES